MDPATAIGLAGSVISIIDVCTRSLNSLMNIQARYQQADLAVRLLLTQLSTLRAAISQISEWISSSYDPFPSTLQVDLEMSLSGCKVLIETLSGYLTSREWDRDVKLNAWQKTQYLWQENERQNFQTLLSHQIAALQLFLTALQW